MASNDQASKFNAFKGVEEEEEKQSFHYRRVCSRAQTCLHKILYIITTIPPPPPPPPPPSPTRAPAARSTPNRDQPSSRNASKAKRGSFAVDLNLSLLDAGENQQNLESPASESAVVSAAEETLNGGERDIVYGASREESSRNDKKCLELLIEAAEVVSGDDFAAAKEKMVSQGLGESTRRNRQRRSRNAAAEEAEEEDYVVAAEEEGVDDVILSPVVRSKRGRTQALPYKFRDSVLEPLTRLSRPSRSSIARRSTSSSHFLF